VGTAGPTPRLLGWFTRERQENGAVKTRVSVRLGAEGDDMAMDAFAIGDTVQISGPVMTGNVGTVVYLDEPSEKYLVRVGAAVQNYFDASELQTFAP
jgi:hypothetical protein